jgi:hypothetical protein
LKLQVTTNLYKIDKLEKNFDDIMKIKNIKNLNFLISYHYFEYIDKYKNNSFINSINILKKYSFNFNIKFLLPDNNESVKNFLTIKNILFLKTNIKEKDCTYDLINNTL